jgi:hypothetical protein
MDAYSAIAKKLDLPQDKAQTMVDELLPALQARQAAGLESLKTEWANETRTDKDLGGSNLTANLGLAKNTLERFGSPAFREFVKATGIGNHPEFIRLLRDFGKVVSEDTLHAGHKPGGPVKTLAQALYPKQKDVK